MEKPGRAPQCVAPGDQAFAAMSPQAKLLIIETVIPPGNDPCFAKLLDITMLVIPLVFFYFGQTRK